MTESGDDVALPHRVSPAQRVRDAATLIVLRHDQGPARILLGQRHAGHAFMPNRFVFPGGRLDPADCRHRPLRDLHPNVISKLMLRMRGRPTASRARGLAVAAVRETFEETGLLLAASGTEPEISWGKIALDLSGLRYFARAITPPGRSRRFDSRFFIADARSIANLDRPWHGGSGELLTPRWFTFAEAQALDLPGITRDVLREGSSLSRCTDTKFLPMHRCVSNIRNAERGGRRCFDIYSTTTRVPICTRL